MQHPAENIRSYIISVSSGSYLKIRLPLEGVHLRRAYEAFHRVPRQSRGTFCVLFRANLSQKKENTIIFVDFHKNEYSTVGLQERAFSFQLQKGRCLAQSGDFRGKMVEKIYTSQVLNMQGIPQYIVVLEKKNNKIYLYSPLTTTLRFGTINEVE